jgi:hypothetical protein
MAKIKHILLATALAVGSLSSPASVLFSENFEYENGSNLNEQGKWVTFGTQANTPITVSTPGLTFDGYQSAAVGAAVQILNSTNSSEQDLHACFSDDGITSGSIYMSALVNVSKVEGEQYFLTFDGSTASSAIAAGKSTSNNWRLFVSPSANDGKFYFGIAKNKTSATEKTAEYSLNTTYLVVLKYEFVEGATNDVLSLYVNQVVATEPSTPTITTSSGNDATTTDNGYTKNFGIGGVAIMQSGSEAKPGPQLQLDALRVATTWAELFGESGGSTTEPEQPAGDAKLTIKSSSSSDEVGAYVNIESKLTYTVKGENLTGDVKISHTNSNQFTISASSISKTNANGKSADVTVTFKSATAGEFTDVITFETAGAEPQSFTVKGTAYAVTSLTTAAAVNNVTPKADDSSVYQYTGKATITFIDKTNKIIYAQDLVGAIAVDYSNLDGLTCTLGDKITNVTCSIEKRYGANYMVAWTDVTIVSSGNTKSPYEVTIADLADDPESYIHQLVKISGVKFNAEEGAKFSTAGIEFTQGENTGKVLAFAGTDVIDSDVPTSEVDLIGISRSTSIVSISPRSLADIEAPVSVEPTRTFAYSEDAAPINTTTAVVKYQVVTQNLPQGLNIEITGANGKMFSVTPSHIDAGSSTTEVVVSYVPTAIGRHTGRINLEAPSTDYIFGESFTFNAYDPQNLPTITVNSSDLKEFSAKPGETQEQKITITTANFVTFGNIKVMGEGNGAFRINNATLLKSGNTALTITFAPQSEGSYSERIEFSALKAETQYITVTGVCQGEKPTEETEGDELKLSTENPLKYLNESFDSTTKNKPVQLTGWTNVAVEGTRAWWGYKFEDDGNSAAKVTAYDSKVAAGEESDCQMILITPPLDYDNAASQLLTFRIMGQNLSEDQTDELSVLYLDLADEGGELYAQTLDGMSIPASSDENDTWVDYVVDLSDKQLAEVFFIGFKFTSTRGVDNSAVYYIDDVTWGRTDVPQIKPSVSSVSEIAKAGIAKEIALSAVGLNLTENIKLSISGTNASQFSLDKTSLPAEGGDFVVTFNSDEVSTHTAYVVLESAGAPVAYISLEVNNTSGVTAITTDENGLYNAYNVLGVKVLSTRDANELHTLAPGIYIVNGKKLVIK